MIPANRTSHGRPIGQTDDPAPRMAGIGGGLLALCLGIAALTITPCLSATTACDMPWVVPAKVLKVVDGDTMDVEIYPWLDTVLKVRVRLARVDCDELHAKTEAKRISAKKATEFTSKQVLTGGIRLAPLGKDSFGRVLGEIFYKVGDKEYNLSDRLLEEGLAMKGYSPERF